MPNLINLPLAPAITPNMVRFSKHAGVHHSPYGFEVLIFQVVRAVVEITRSQLTMVALARLNSLITLADRFDGATITWAGCTFRAERGPVAKLTIQIDIPDEQLAARFHELAIALVAAHRACRAHQHKRPLITARFHKRQRQLVMQRTRYHHAA